MLRSIENEIAYNEHAVVRKWSVHYYVLAQLFAIIMEKRTGYRSMTTFQTQNQRTNVCSTCPEMKLPVHYM